MNRQFKYVGALLLLSCLFVNTVAAQQGSTRRVRFARGRTTAVLKGAVVRGTQDRFVLGAKAGQTLLVHITSIERNAAFLIYEANKAQPLSGMTEGEDVMDWSGPLPATGDYSIVVGPTRGNATYTLEVTIR